MTQSPSEVKPWHRLLTVAVAAVCGLILLSGLLFALFLVWSRIERITIANKSGRRINSLEVAGNRLGPIEPERSRTKWIWIRAGKTTFHFRADFDVGTTTGTAVGYVTEFMAGKSVVTLLPNGHFDVKEIFKGQEFQGDHH